MTSNWQEQFSQALNGNGLDIIEQIRPGGSLPCANDAIQIYAKSSATSRFEALGERYPSCWRVLGDADFIELGRCYGQQHPSINYNLNFYGEHFAQFLRGQCITKEFPFISDLAAYENARYRLFHAASSPALATHDLQQRIAHDTPIYLGKQHATLTTQYPVAQWYAELENAVHVPQELYLPTPTTLLLYKQNEAIDYQTLSATTQKLVELLRSGTQLSQLDQGIQCADPAEIEAFFAFLRAKDLLC